MQRLPKIGSMQLCSHNNYISTWTKELAPTTFTLTSFATLGLSQPLVWEHHGCISFNGFVLGIPHTQMGPGAFHRHHEFRVETVIDDIPVQIAEIRKSDTGVTM